MHPRKEILVLLNFLIEPSTFVEEYRINVLKRLVGIVVSNDKILGKKRDYLCLRIDSMIRNKVNSTIEVSTNR